MNLKAIIVIVFISLSWGSVSAQNSLGNNLFIWDYRFHGLQLYNKDWSFNVGFNVLDDSGNQLERAPRPSTDWNFSNPFLLGVEFYYNSSLSFATTISFNKMKEDKDVDSSLIIEGHEPTYFAADLVAKLYGRDFFRSYFFDPYILLGMGYTKIGAYKANNIGESPPSGVEIDEDGNLVVPAIGRMTVNVGAGFNFWFNRTWAFTTGFMSKWGLDTKNHSRGRNSISNQLQYTFGLTYFIKNRSLRLAGE